MLVKGDRLDVVQARNMRSRWAAYCKAKGYGDTGSIPDGMTFRAWCEDLASRGMKVDRKPFTLADRGALVPIYDAIPSTRAEAAGRLLVVQKATQLGLTVWETLADLYMAKKWGPVNIGLFLPDQATASFKSERRFMPIARSVPELYRELTHRMDEEGQDRRIGEGNVLTREFADSLLMFLWTTGKVTTESRPMDIVSLDEVQEMALDQIDKVRARLGDSDVAFTLMLSTANMPELDINFWYREGTQEVWHTECPHCHALSDLSDPVGVFPAKSIVYNTGQIASAPENEYLWACPACGGWIEDPQQGHYIPQNPGADPKIRSFLLPRTISPRMTPRMMMEQWGRARTGDQKKSFYNRTLARPYIDADQLPVTMTHCLACVEEGRRAGVVWETTGRDTFMGIDQMGGFNTVIVKRRLPDGRQALIHVEAIWGEEPFERCEVLMRQYGVAVCVVETLPNINSARRFANHFPRRVFLAGYGDLRDDAMIWGDDLSKSDRRTAEEDRTRYTVTLNQYRCMQATLYRVRDRMCLFPDPDLLIQDVIDNGQSKRIPILRDWVFYHLTKTALVVEENEETRKPRAKVRKVGIDPHFSFAAMLCDVAWTRSYGMSSIFMPDAVPVGSGLDAAARMEKAMPGIPREILAVVASVPDGTCGRCDAFEDGLCTERQLKVQARDVGCPLFVARENGG